MVGRLVGLVPEEVEEEDDAKKEAYDSCLLHLVEHTKAESERDPVQ